MNKFYDHGYQAFTSGLDFTKNPYKKGTIESEEWASGWEDAATDDESLLEEDENYLRHEQEFD